jgi:predicted DNA-binding protein (UPF0251 family)
MNMTARQVVDEEVIKWLERDELLRLGRAQRLPQLEASARIWEYGKWTANNGLHLLGVKPQIKFRGSRPVATIAESIRDISDDEGMEIHATTLDFDARTLEILRRVYEERECCDDAIREMRIRRQTFFDLRWDALQTITDRLTGN